MKYEISQYWEQVVDSRQLWYKIKGKGKHVEYEMEITGADNLLYILHEGNKVHKGKLEIQWPMVAVDWGVMEAIRNAYEKGWLTTLPPNPLYSVSAPVTPEVTAAGIENRIELSDIE